jgi:hypothetical protein
MQHSDEVFLESPCEGCTILNWDRYVLEQ